MPRKRAQGDVNVSGDLQRAFELGGMEGLLAVAKHVAEESDRNAPKGDPEKDPSPDVHLHAQVQTTPLTLRVRVFYDEPYAVKQHEALHYKHPRGGGPKFLERAVKSAAPAIEQILAQRIRAHLDNA